MSRDDWMEQLNSFWTPFLACLTLLGVYLLLLGIALAGLVTALRRRERERTELLARQQFDGREGPGR
jgi:hypothetical protein